MLDKGRKCFDHALSKGPIRVLVSRDLGRPIVGCNCLQNIVRVREENHLGARMRLEQSFRVCPPHLDIAKPLEDQNRSFIGRDQLGWIESEGADQKVLYLGSRQQAQSRMDFP